MNRTLIATQRRFALVILMLVIAITSLTWGILEVVNEASIGKKIDTAELHAHTSQSAELHEYVASQKPYEAHFIALSNSIREQDQERLTTALAITALGVSIAGIILAIAISKVLMKPIEDAHRSQERFLQDAAHELRNPLAALSIALQQAKHTAYNKELLQTFWRQTKRLVSINEDLLFLERKVEKPLERTDLSSLMLDCIEELQPIAYKKKIEIDATIEDGIVKTMAPSDFIKVAKNLVDNAIKYSEPSSRITINLHKKGQSKIRLIVVDSGIGIPEHELKTVGNRFFRASNVGAIDGTGLGIAIVKKILNSYGGEIELTSPDSGGTTATVKLPS
jgi:signal transduction histidine kinase